MTCYHPLKGFKIGLTPNKKPKYLIQSYDVDFVRDDYGRVISDFVEIPCGRCIGCRIDYSRQWANRCLLESQYHKDTYFVTLTYNDQHVPLSQSYDVNGQVFDNMTLCKRDFQLFMKRLRKRTGQKLRYFACGEYGTTTFRPHYHAIIFGLELNDLQFHSKSDSGYVLYNSPLLSDVWSVDGVPLGYAVVSPSTWETCAYTARYVTKKLSGSLASFYDINNIEPEFCLMSRRPGIARQYYEDHKDHLYDYEFINISTEKGGKKFVPPRYFDNLKAVEDPELISNLKEHRLNMAKENQRLKMEDTSLSYLDMLEVEERSKMNRVKKLIREGV